MPRSPHHHSHVSLFGLLFFVAVTIVAIVTFAYPNGRLTCGHYVLNAYLYIILSVLLASLVATQVGTVYENSPSQEIPPAWKHHLTWLFHSLSGTFCLFVITIGALFVTMRIDPQQTALKHVAWLVFVSSFGLMLHPIYAYTLHRNVFVRTALTTLTMVVGLTFIALWCPEWIALSWRSALLVMLFAGIVIRIVMLVFQPKRVQTIHSNNRHPVMAQRLWREWLRWDEVLSWGFVVLFSLLLIYDTKRLHMHARQCVVPDYINDSIGIFLDISNMFANMGRVH